jgi:CO/xanthine dehydrogenase FAD-binding subunit
LRAGSVAPLSNLAALGEAAQVIGGHQIRNIATVGGNVVNAPPAADLLPVLLTLDAQVVLTGGRGTRCVSLAGFLRGPGDTDRRDDELLTHVAFTRPAPRPRQASQAPMSPGCVRSAGLQFIWISVQPTRDSRNGT